MSENTFSKKPVELAYDKYIRLNASNKSEQLTDCKNPHELLDAECLIYYRNISACDDNTVRLLNVFRTETDTSGWRGMHLYQFLRQLKVRVTV